MIKVTTKTIGDRVLASVLDAGLMEECWEYRGFSLEALEVLHNESLRLRELALIDEVPKPDFGICYNLQNLVLNSGRDVSFGTYSFVSTCAATWPFTTGPLGLPVAYPVPEPEDNPDPWLGKYLGYRISLLEHIIRCAEAMMHTLTTEDASE